MLAWWADAYNPTLTLLAILVLSRTGSWRAAGIRLGALVAAMAPVYIGKFALKPLLEQHLAIGFSTHVGYAIALSGFLCAYARTPWRVMSIFSTFLYALLVIQLGYHDIGDVALTIALISLSSWGAYAWIRVFNTEAMPASPTREQEDSSRIA